MRRAVRWAMRLYPGAWRRRYGAEFEALLEDVRPGGRELWDVAAGGLKMQMLGWTWRKTAAAFALAGAAVAGAVAARTPNVYVSTAVVRMGSGPEARRGLARAEGDVLSRSSLAAIIQQRGLYPEERKRQPLEDIVQAMRNRHIRIAPVEGGLAVSFSYPDRATAQQVTGDLTSRLLESAVTGRNPMRLEVLNGASLPEAPVSPNRPAIVGAGLAAGLALGFVFLGVRRWPVVAACGAAAALAALAIAFLIPDRWVSTAVMRLDAGADAGQLIRDTLADKNLEDIIVRPGMDLYRSERQKMPLDAVVRRMRDRDVRIVPLRHAPDGASAFAISFAADDRFKAQAAVRLLVTRMTEQNVAEVRQLAERPVTGHNLEVLDPASLPEQPAEPNRLSILLLGLAIGIGGGAAIARRRRSRTLAAGAA